jgi:hypothetical protein
VPITLLAIAMASRNTLEEKMAANHRDGTQALFIAESGIEQALAMLRAPGGIDNGFNDELVSGLGFDNVALGDGTFTVTIRDNADGGTPPEQDDTDGDIILHAVGNAAAGKREVEVVVRLLPGPTLQQIAWRELVN